LFGDISVHTASIFVRELSHSSCVYLEKTKPMTDAYAPGKETKRGKMFWKMMLRR
jgi:hypothetical protein